MCGGRLYLLFCVVRINAPKPPVSRRRGSRVSLRPTIGYLYHSPTITPLDSYSKIATSTTMGKEKIHISLVVIGHVDAGKSRSVMA